MIVQSFLPDFDLDPESVAGIIALILGYILGTAIEDGMQAKGK